MAKVSHTYIGESGKSMTAHAPCNSRDTCTHKKHGYPGKSAVNSGRARWPRAFVVGKSTIPVS